MDRVMEVNELTKTYRNGRGIKSVSFDIYKGEIFGFLGPNGAGKTTTMKIITGLCGADAGEVKIFGHNALSNHEAAMRNVGCIIETVEPYEYLSGYCNLELAARFYPDLGREKIEKALEQVGLERYGHEKAGTYSLGMKQRLGLAAAMLSDPELIILDEPANGLDIEGIVDIRNIITRLSAEYGVTFFISSHMVHEMETMCSRVGIIRNGRMSGTADVKELKENGSSLEEFYIGSSGEEMEGMAI